MKHRLYKLYWIKTKDMLNPYTEGYIGITKNSLKLRLSQHKHSKRPIGYKLREKDVEVTIEELHRGMKEDMLHKEYEYRPEQHIGWNIMAGGNDFKGTFTEHNYGKGEKYELIDPEGNIYRPEVFTVFCRERGLTPQNLRKVAKGTRKNHKGWLAKKLYNK